MPDPSRHGGHAIDQFALVCLWPITITVDDERWFTIWGDGAGEKDVLLAAEGHLVLARSLSVLYEWVLGSQSNLRSMPMGGAFIDAVTNAQWPTDRVDGEYELSPIPQWLRAGWSGWSAAQVDTTLNTLNLLWDAAQSIDNRSIVDVLRPNGRLGEFLDDLYQVEGLLQPDRPAEADIAARARRILQRWNGEELATHYEQSIDELFRGATRI